MKKTLPPVIRIFISSTFADMENERNYFNSVIAPELVRRCAMRGVSFFSVDLRWGITEEEQMNGEVLPICLNEIDKCRPFFIGILGNRYGSVLEEVTESLVKSFPWLKDKAGKSVTELEMLYGVLENESGKEHTDCAFCFRSDELSEQFYKSEESPEKLKKLSDLKNLIKAKENISSFEYHSLDEFGKQIIENFSNWLDREFPTVESVKKVRRDWYNRELQRDYFQQNLMGEFLNRYCESSNKSLLIHGDGLSGKTTFLTNWEPEKGKKILINCEADIDWCYWPEIAREIINQINDLDEAYGSPDFDAKATLFFRMAHWGYERKAGESLDEKDDVIYFVTDGELESFRNGFVSWLQNLELKEQVYIIINDINLISDKSSYYLSWLPAQLPEYLHIICSANTKEIVKNAEMVGWNCKEMSLISQENVSSLLDIFIHNYGKNLSREQKENICRTDLLKYPGYLKFVMKFLIVYGKFENLDYLTKCLGEMKNIREIYRFVLDFIVSSFDEKERKCIYYALAFLYNTAIPLREEECYTLVSKMVSITPLVWSKVRIVLEQFEAIHGDAWKLENREFKEIIEESLDDLKKVESLLAEHFLKMLKSEKSGSSLRRIKSDTDYAKAVIHHYTNTEDWEQLSASLCDRTILYYLTKLDWRIVRAAWMKILLHSEINVAERLMKLLKAVREENSNIEGIQYSIVSLFLDLELHETLAEAEELTGIQVQSELSCINSAMVSESFIDKYNYLVDLKNNRDYRALRAISMKFLNDSSDLSSYEKASIYKFKSEAELKMRLMQEGLETTGEYYIESIRAMHVKSVLDAVLTRGNFLYFAGEWEKTREILLNAQKMAEELGSLRDYLAIENILAMCCYREKKFEQSIKLFDYCIEMWKKVRNVQEAVNCGVNRCNAIHLKGDSRMAIQESQKLYHYLNEAGAEKYVHLRVMILDNIGNYSIQSGDTKGAEKAYLQALQEAKGTYSEQTTGNIYYNLIKLYKDENMIMKAFEVYEQFTDYLFANRQFSDFMSALEDEIDLLNRAGYMNKAKAVMEKWEKIFEKIPNGKQILQGIFAKSTDKWKIQQLKEAVLMAKSSNDMEKYAELLSELAQASRQTDENNVIDLYLESAKCFEKLGKQNKCKTVAVKALYYILHIEKSYTNSKIEEFQAFLDENEKEIAVFWAQSASVKEYIAKEENLKQVFPKLISAVAESARRGMETAEYCMLGLADAVAEVCDSNCILNILAKLKETSSYKAFTELITDKFLENFIEDLNRLKQNYQGEETDEILAFYEKAVDVLKATDNMNSAAIAGNIAVIFRRRKEEEKTFYYHKVSMEMYKAYGKTRDCLIEAMNLATAYKECGRMVDCIELLRTSLKDANNSGCKDIEASIAGNVAAILLEQNSSKYDSEIISCFKIEEEYFRMAGEARELIISLINQIKFYMRDSGRYEKIMKEKYMEIEKLALQYQIHDFDSVLSSLRNIFQENNVASNKKEEKKSGLFGRIRDKFKK